MRYQFIQEHENRFDTKVLCKIVEVSRSGYYAWRDRPERPRAKANQSLTRMIIDIFRDSRETYGHRRVQKSLIQQGISASKHRVSRLMKAADLAPKTRKKFKATTNSKHKLPIHENHLQRNFSPEAINQSWSSDITYIWTHEGWLYLAVILDMFSTSHWLGHGQTYDRRPGNQCA